MANKTVRVLLNAASFPFDYSQVGRSVLDPVDMNNRMPSSFFGDKANMEFALPQLIYCENVLPYAKGIFSVSYAQQIAAISPATVLADQAIQLRDNAENQLTFIPAAGANYVLDPVTSLWSSVNPFTFANSLVTRAYVNGRTFVCYEKTKIIEYVAGVFNAITLTFPPGLAITDVRGIGSASNYLLLFTELTVYWCSPLNLLEFADMDAGAGNAAPVDLHGKITCLLPLGGGFVIYSTKNAVAAAYTQNSNSPFAFKEISGAGGTTAWETVTADANDQYQYLWGSSGLQRITLQAAETIFPEVTDFLVGGKDSNWNATTKTVDVTEVGGVFDAKLSFLAGRYLVISYGDETRNLTAALVLDVVLERWGKLKIDHVDAFMYTYPAYSLDYTYDQLPGFYKDLRLATYSDLSIVRALVTPPKQGIAFLKKTGEIQVLIADFVQTTADGVALFGRLQQRHDRDITVTDVEIEGLRDLPAYTISLLGSETGDTRDSITTPTLKSSVGEYKKFDSRVTAKNFDLALEGNFVTSTILLQVMNHGYR